MANKHLFSNGTSNITSVYLSTGEEGTAVPILIDSFEPLKHMWDITYIGSLSTNKHDYYHCTTPSMPFYDYEKDLHPFDFERILIVGTKEFLGFDQDVSYEQKIQWLKVGYIHGRLINPQILFMPSRDLGVKEVKFSHYDTTTDDSTDHAAIIVYEGTIDKSAIRMTPSKRVGGKTAYPNVWEAPYEDRSDVMFFGLGLPRQKNKE